MFNQKLWKISALIQKVLIWFLGLKKNTSRDIVPFKLPPAPMPFLLKDGAGY